MSAESVQDAIVAKLLADTNVSAEFGINISKGMGRNFDFLTDQKGIRVYQMLENVTRVTVTHSRVDATYPFLLIVLFYEPNEANGETRKTRYSEMVRNVFERDVKISDTAYDSRVGDTRFYFHPTVEGAYYMAIPLIVRKREVV